MPYRNENKEEGSRAVVQTTRTLLFLQEYAERNKGVRFRPQKKYIRASEFRREQKQKERKREKEEEKKRKQKKELEPEPDSFLFLKKGSHAPSSRHLESKTGRKQIKEELDNDIRSRQIEEEKRREVYADYIRQKKEKKKQAMEERKKGIVGTAGYQRNSVTAERCFQTGELTVESPVFHRETIYSETFLLEAGKIKRKEEAFKQRKKGEQENRKKSRRKKRHSRAARHMKGKMHRILWENTVILKTGVMRMPAKNLLMIADDLEAEKLAKQAATTGIRMILRLFRQMNVLFFTAAKSVLLFLSPTLLLSVVLFFMLYTIFFSPFSYLFESNSTSGEEGVFPYRMMWEEVNDYTEVEAGIKSALSDRQTELLNELRNPYESVRLISFALTPDEIADYILIMKAMMIMGGVYPEDRNTWIMTESGKMKCKELAELVCHILTDEEVAAQYPELVTEPITGPTGEIETQESEIKPHYVEKYMGFYSLEDLKKSGKLKDYEIFLD